MLFLIPFLLLGINNVLTSGLYVKLELNENKMYNLDEAEDIFVEFIKKYAKKYENEKEYEHRLQIFIDNLNKINEWNKDNTAEFKVNHFADTSHEEFGKVYGCTNLGNSTEREGVEEYVPTVNAPDSLDWRTYNYVTKVKNQMSCGSCYIFGAIGCIEGQHAKLYNELISLSEQQGLDCNPYDCGGGESVAVMNSLALKGGSMREEEYPYQGEKDQCRTKQDRIVVRVTGGQQLGISDEESLKSALAEYGPLTVYIFVSHQMQFYNGGIFLGTDCDKEEVNHAVLLVGYGIDDVTPYWIIKNSWGPMWGESGYIRLFRGGSVCQIGNYAILATVE